MLSTMTNSTWLSMVRVAACSVLIEVNLAQICKGEWKEKEEVRIARRMINSHLHSAVRCHRSRPMDRLSTPEEWWCTIRRSLDSSVEKPLREDGGSKRSKVKGDFGLLALLENVE